MSEKNELTTAELTALVTKLQTRIEALEASVENLRAARPVPEEDLMAIAAAAAAYLGYRGKVKAVRYAGSQWSEASRRSRTTNLSRGNMPRPMM